MGGSMDKPQIIEEKLSLIAWSESLKGLADDVWFSSFKEGSWGIADVISHFISWDQFLLDYRLPFIIRSEEIPAVKVDVEEINGVASRYARSGITRVSLINDFIATRSEVVSQIENIPAEKFHEPIIIGKSSLILSNYFTDLIEHDRTHRNQINTFLKKHN